MHLIHVVSMRAQAAKLGNMPPSKRKQKSSAAAVIVARSTVTRAAAAVAARTHRLSPPRATHPPTTPLTPPAPPPLPPPSPGVVASESCLTVLQSSQGHLADVVSRARRGSVERLASVPKTNQHHAEL